MSTIYDITHRTLYRYAKPVGLGEHRVMFRPRDGHDLRVLATDLTTAPAPAQIRLIHDVYSNSVAIVTPQSPAQAFEITCTFTVEHTGEVIELPVDPSAENYPFEYGDEDRHALQHFLEPCWADAAGELREWAGQFIAPGGATRSLDLLVRMTAAIRDQMHYVPREEEGVQTPSETLALRSGTCRDFATLMIEAVRCLGFAARFVSGYLYSPDPLDGGPQIQGAGATHAWLQVYLPGAGWLAFDPTNNLVGGTHLIRVGFARHAGLASPVSGTWFGDPEDFLGMEVGVDVRRRD